jgi:uncharacterized protein
MRRPVSTLLSALLFCFALAAQVPEIPASRVTDTTGTLQPQQIETLSTKLKALEDKNGTQILVYMTATTNGMPIEDFGIQAARKWKPGQKKDNNGAILLIAKNDRKMRIEVGRGLEGVMTDTATKAILDDTLRPNFRSGNFYGGIDQAITQMIGMASKEAFVAPTAAQKAAATQTDDSSGWYWFFGFLVVGGAVWLGVWGYRKHKREEEEAAQERLREARRRTEESYEQRLQALKSPVTYPHNATVPRSTVAVAAAAAVVAAPKRSSISSSSPSHHSSSYDHSSSSSSSSSSDSSSSSWSSGGGSFDGGGSSGSW